MWCIYGPVPLRVTRLLDYSAEAIFDPSGTDYLYTKYLVSLEACWGRLSDGYAIDKMTPNGPVPKLIESALSSVANGVKSVHDTRHALSQPRQLFALYTLDPVTNGANLLLGCDGIDAAAGPRVVSPPSVTSIHGGGALVFVRLAIELCLNDCSYAENPTIGVGELRTSPEGVVRKVKKKFLRGSFEPFGVPRQNPRLVEPPELRQRRRVQQFLQSDLGKTLTDPVKFAQARGDQGLRLLSLNGRPLLLSNRWTTSVSYDSTDESTIYNHRGQAIFRADGLHAFRIASIDSFRSNLLPPLPAGCKREINDISQSADGRTLSYDITDRQGVRDYIDWRVQPNPDVPGSVLRVPDATPRFVAGISLVTRREFSQPSVGNAVFDFFDDLQTIQFALPRAEEVAGLGAVAGAIPGLAGGPAGGAVGGVGGAIAGFIGSPFLKAGIAALRTVNRTLPTTVESAEAAVQITREGTLADAQSLAFALISGGLDYGIPQNGRLTQALQTLRFTLLPPANSIYLECDHVRGAVKAGMTVQQSGIIDFINLGQGFAFAKLFKPLRDEVIGGIPPASLTNLFRFLQGVPGLAPVLNGLTQLTPLSFNSLVEIIKKIDSGPKFAGELLISDSDLILRGPSQDNFSRSAADVLLRSAALLLKPCVQQKPPANLDTGVFKGQEHARAIELVGSGNVHQAGPSPGEKLFQSVFDALNKNKGKPQ